MTDPSLDLRSLRRTLTGYQQAHTSRSIAEIVLTVTPLGVIWALAWWAALTGAWWLALLLSLPASVFVVRLFAIQHDCGHQSFFLSGTVNDWVGRVIGILTLTPYDCWRREHAVHHATSGNLDRRGPGEVKTLTVAEYAALGPLQRLGYRLYRHPVILFLVGPFFVFFLQQRLPVGLTREGWRPWASAMGTNLALIALTALAVWFGGWGAFVLIHVPTMLIAASIGVWLFFVQHQFDSAAWARTDGWDHTEAALRGSSYYDLPGPLRWLTANIGIHHVHHVASRIPFYRLPAVLQDQPALKSIGRVTLMESFSYAKLALWDEDEQRLISFHHLTTVSSGLSAPG